MDSIEVISVGSDGVALEAVAEVLEAPSVRAVNIWEGSGDPDWFGLPTPVVALMSTKFRSPLLLQAAFDSLDEAMDLVSSFPPELVPSGEFLGELLDSWRRESSRHFKRARFTRIL